jgi:hypothetical protein
MEVVEAVVSVAAGPHQFAINAKGGCDMVQWVRQIIMEAEPDLARAYLDAINAFVDLERLCIRAALLADILLHPLTPLYDAIYTRGCGELCTTTRLATLSLRSSANGECDRGAFLALPSYASRPSRYIMR